MVRCRDGRPLHLSGVSAEPGRTNRHSPQRGRRYAPSDIWVSTTPRHRSSNRSCVSVDAVSPEGLIRAQITSSPHFGCPHDDRVSTVKQQVEVRRRIETRHWQHGPRPGPKPQGTPSIAVVEVEHARFRRGKASPLPDLNVRNFRLKARHHRHPSHMPLPRTRRTHRSNTKSDTRSDQSASLAPGSLLPPSYLVQKISGARGWSNYLLRENDRNYNYLRS